MQHYWGARAIMQRLDLKSYQTLYRQIRQYGLPVYLRVNPKAPIRRALYSNEALLCAWELSMCKDYRERLIGGQHVPDPVRILRAPAAKIQVDMRATVEREPEDTSATGRT